MKVHNYSVRDASCSGIVSLTKLARCNRRALFVDGGTVARLLPHQQIKKRIAAAAHIA